MARNLIKTPLEFLKYLSRYGCRDNISCYLEGEDIGELDYKNRVNCPFAIKKENDICRCKLFRLERDDSESYRKRVRRVAKEEYEKLEKLKWLEELK